MLNVIVVGCGRVGSRLAGMLSDNGANVAVVDKRAEAFSNLGRNFNGNTIQGIGYDEKTLERAGIDGCDIVAAVTQSDNANLMVCEVASHLYDVPHVISRLYNTNHERAYMQLGIDYACGTTLVAEEIFSKVLAGHSAHVDTFGDYELLRFSLDLSSTESNSIKVHDITREHDISIVAFERKDGSSSSIPTGDSTLHHGDIVLACVRHDLIDSFSEYIQR